MSDIATAVAAGIVLAAQLGMVAVIMPIVVRELRAIRGALSDAPEKPAKTAEKSRIFYRRTAVCKNIQKILTKFYRERKAVYLFFLTNGGF